jgi:hypothetical protein
MRVGFKETTLELRGIPLWLLEKYVLDLGGQPGNDGWLAGDGWQVRLTQIEDYQMGLLKVGQVRLEWQADDLAQANTWPRLANKLVRPGG